MKILKHFLLSLVLVATGIAQLDAMKRAQPDSGLDSDETQNSKKHKPEQPNVEQQEARPIGIFIQHLGTDRTGVILNSFIDFLQVTYNSDNAPQYKPIIMVSPDIVSSCMKERPNLTFIRQAFIRQDLIF